jgi:predicted hotdog family 3-hydroxylacyl-ACP dehydratase
MRRPAVDFVPHRPPMLCLDEIGEDTADSVVCYTTIRPDFVFLDGDSVRPVVMIELVAQACAAYVGVKAHREGKPPKVGMLVGCREAEFLVDGLNLGDALCITVHRTFGQVQVAAFTGTVARGGAVIGRVSLSVVDGDLALEGEL